MTHEEKHITSERIKEILTLSERNNLCWFDEAKEIISLCSYSGQVPRAITPSENKILEELDSLYNEYDKDQIHSHEFIEGAQTSLDLLEQKIKSLYK